MSNISHEGETSDSAIRTAAMSFGLIEELHSEVDRQGGPDYVFNDGRGVRYVAEPKS